MKSTSEIHESYLAPGVNFTLKDHTIKEVMNARKMFINITGMMWICNRATIAQDGYLDQGHSLIMIWLN